MLTSCLASFTKGFLTTRLWCTGTGALVDVIELVDATLVLEDVAEAVVTRVLLVPVLEGCEEDVNATLVLEDVDASLY